MGTVELVETFEDAGKALGDVGKGELVIIMIARTFGSHYLNQSLGNVKILSMVTHLMLLEHMFPSVTVVFFEGLFEYVTFDAIPTENFYKVTFGWINEPYSQHA